MVNSQDSSLNENSVVFHHNRIAALNFFFVNKSVCLSFVFFISIILFSSSTNGQGCSDAGFCSINSIKSTGDDSLSSEKLNQIKAGAFYGIADNSISVWGNYIEYSRKLSGKTDLDIKVTSLSQNGNGISTFGAGDLFVVGNHALNDSVKFTFGLKIPFSNGNTKRNNVSLPMDFQSGLGTIDLLLGCGFRIKKLQLILALQQPLTQNKNEFFSDDYPAVSPISQFQTTNNFIRSGDVFLRISYPVKITQRIKLTPGLLPIYHLSNDRFTDGSGIKKEIPGSKGLTLNANFNLDFEVKENSVLQFSAAAPFIVRETRPDGLTRSLIVSLEYRFRF
ncbi:MAG: hypothetical protein ACO1G9_09075 [Bacteroidota bacterium]